MQSHEPRSINCAVALNLPPNLGKLFEVYATPPNELRCVTTLLVEECYRLMPTFRVRLSTSRRFSFESPRVSLCTFLGELDCQTTLLVEEYS